MRYYLKMLIGLIVGIISFSTTVSGLTLDTQIASSSDDAEEQSAGNVKVTSSMLDLIEDGGVMQIVGMRFANLNIPKNANILNAYIQFTAKRASSVSTNLIIQGEYVANPNPFNGTRLNLSSRSKTTESVNWSPQAWSKGSVSQTSDIGSIVQSLVNQSDWSSGNAMAFIVSGVGQRVAVSYDGLANNAPTLHIEYTLPVVVVEDPVIEMVSYEDAEDEDTVGWTIYDNSPTGATITNVYDGDRGSRVIELKGLGKSNAYQLGTPSGEEAWNNKIDRTLQWSMNINETFKVYAIVNTTNGVRYISYTHNTVNGSFNGFDGSNTITIGLGDGAKNGTWQTFTRNLEEDLAEYDPTSAILSVNGFRVYGSGRFDDIEMVAIPTPNDIEAPVITLNGNELLNLSLNGSYEELGAVAIDDILGKVKVEIVSTVDTAREGSYSVIYTATDRANNSSSVTRTVNVSSTNLDNVALILNEYNAVAPDKQLKNSGSDSYFGQINGNGGSWMEMVVVGTHVNLCGATLRIKEAGNVTFEGTIPQHVQLEHLRRGTILTISNEPTNMSYAPFNPHGDDWVLNLNSNDLLNTMGIFNLNDNAITIEIVANEKNILVESGDDIVHVGIDSQEVFKLKANPSLLVAPFNSAYGDDENQKAMSTFGEPNQWRDANGVLQTQNFDGLRLNRDLNEVGGIVLSDIQGLVGLRDAESIFYMPENNSFWVTDDNAHKIYEMDFTTKEVKNIYTSSMLEDFSGICRDAQHQVIPNCQGLSDLEGIAYRQSDDTLFFFVGHASSTPAIFRLTRNSLEESFHLGDNDANTVDFRVLGDLEYPASQYVEEEMIVAIGNQLFAYDFETNTLSSPVYTADISKYANIYGLAYDSNNGVLWAVTSKNYLLKIDWSNKELLTEYQMADKDSIETYNGVYDTRGLEIINNELYILEGMNTIGKKGAAEAPYGNALKNAIHIYTTPDNNL